MSLLSQRGTKRRADGTELPRRIEALHEDVVNKIAAGEIIVAPVNALKELIENAVDAGATNLEILVKDGGLKLLQITDNGCGIDKDDLSILCERFTTSKLKKFEDLMEMQTYGFRGEALASISHIAHLTVTTKTAESVSAWRANYSGGKLVAKGGQSEEPKPTAGRQGTQIQVEDMFYNMPNRKQAFRTPSEEYAKIVEMVGRYAIHCKDVAFSCKKHGEAGPSVVVPAHASIKDRIRNVYNSTIANELLAIESRSEHLGFKATGQITNVNYNGKKTIFLLFINHRSVESTAFKRSIEAVYTAFLPKGGKPFVYLDLEIDPARVDVNVHPTKKEIGFLNEDEITDLICLAIKAGLGQVDTSRAFVAQTVASGRTMPSLSRDNTMVEIMPEDKQSATPRPGQPKKVNENNLVRTDGRSQKITALFSHQSVGEDDGLPVIQYEENDRAVFVCNLATVMELRNDVLENAHEELTDVFGSHTFVGIVDECRRIAAIQGGTKLYLVDYGLYSAEFFYQVGLTDFGNFGTITFDPPLDLRQLLQSGVEDLRLCEEANADLDSVEVADAVTANLVSHRAMLNEYFSFEITEEAQLVAVPLMIKGYIPCMAKLPAFLLRTGPYVDWTDEKRCFETFLRELAGFYVPERLPLAEGESEMNEDVALVARRGEMKLCLEQVLFRAFKSRLIATKALLRGTKEIADIRGLYRVFERC